MTESYLCIPIIIHFTDEPLSSLVPCQVHSGSSINSYGINESMNGWSDEGLTEIVAAGRKRKCEDKLREDGQSLLTS